MAAFARVDHDQGAIVSNIPSPQALPTESAPSEGARTGSRTSSIQPQLPDRDPPEGYKALALDYPFTLILGGLALGAIAGALLPRSATRKLGRGAVVAAGVAGELGLAYGRQALETAVEVSGGGREKLGALGEKLMELGETVGAGASDAAGSARDTGLKIVRQVIRLTSQLRH